MNPPEAHGDPEVVVIKPDQEIHEQPREEFHIIASPLFPGFVEICREDGPYICFNQLRARHFRSLPRGTLSGWVHKLGIEKLKCTEKEHAILKLIVPEEKGKPFFLMKPGQARQLLDRSRERLADLNVRASALYQGNCMTPLPRSTGDPRGIPSKTPFLLPRPPSPPPPPPPSPPPPPPSPPQQPPLSRYQWEGHCDAGGQASSQAEDPQSDSEDDGSGETPVTPPAAAHSKKLAKSRAHHTIQDADMSGCLRRDFDDLVVFYSATFEGRRKGPSLSQQTVVKMVERLKMYFYYIKFCRATEPDFSHLESRPLLEDYAKYMTDVRHLKAVTVSRNIHALEKGLLFGFRNKPTHEREQSQPLVALRNIRIQCEKVSRLDKMKEKEGVGCKPKQSIIYAEILELCKELKSSFEEETNTLQKARTIHDLVLLLIYLHFVPRAHEVRTLVLEEGFPAADIVKVGPGRENVIAFYDDGSIELLLTKYKTDKCYGPSKIPVPFNSPIAYYLRQYVSKFRGKLLMGSGHACMFVNARGHEFASASAFSRYLGQIIESGTGKKGATNSLRHAIATKFVADPELCANEAFRNSLCRVMRHSRETQEKCYVDLTNAAKSEQALGILSQSAENELFGDCTVTEANSSNQSTSDGEDEMAPSVGDLVALVDPQATSDEPHIFVAKVIRFSTTREEAILAEFEEVEESCFRLKIQNYRPWVESVNSLIWPIDIAYSSESRAYKLRTPKRDIYDSVVSPRKKRKVSHKD